MPLPSSPPAAPWRSRIVSHGVLVDPHSLLSHPQNFRAHPKAQRDLLRRLMTAVGSVQNPLVNRRTGRIIDGHARVALAIDQGAGRIAVDYVDLSDADERLALGTHDTITALAIVDSEKLDALLERAGELANPPEVARQSGEDRDDGPTSKEAKEIYRNNPMRQLVLHYLAAEYDELIQRLDVLVDSTQSESRLALISQLLQPFA